MKKTSFFLILTLSMVTGCQRASSPSVVHEKAPVREKPKIETPEPVEGVKITAQQEKQVIDQIQAGGLLSILEPSALSDPRLKTSEKALVKLGSLNEGLLKLQGAPGESSKGVLKKYEVALLEGCDWNLNGCKNLSFFKRDQRSSAVSRIVADTLYSDQPLKHYQLMNMALALKNSSGDDGVERRFVQMARVYDKSLREYDKQNSTQILSSFTGNLSRILQVLNEKSILDDSPRSVSWRKALSSLNLWSQLIDENSVISPAEVALSRLVAQFDLYSDKEKTKVSPSMAEAIKKLSASENSYVNIKKFIIEKDPEALKRVGLTTELANDESLYILEGLYNNWLSLDGASVIFQKSRQDSSRFAQAISIYLKTRFVYETLSTNFHMHSFLENDRRITESNMIDEIMRELDGSKRSWSELEKKSQVFYSFFNADLEARLKDKELVSRVRSELRELPRSIKYSVIYPLKFVMIHYMIKRNFKWEFTFYTRSWIIRTDRVLNDLYEAQVPVLFELSSDLTPLKYDELLYAFRFAMQLGTFSTFGVDVDDFIAKFGEQLVLPQLGVLENASTFLKTRYFLNPDFQSFQKVCAEDKKWTQNPNYKPDYTVTVPLTSLPYYTFLGTLREPQHQVSFPYQTHEYMGIASSFFGQWPINSFDDKGFLPSDEAVEQTRLEFSNRVNFIKMLKRFAEISGQTDFPLTDKFLQKVEFGHGEFMGKLFKLTDATLPCLNHLIEREFSRQMLLINAERSYLLKVHAAMKAMSESSSFTDDAAAFNSDLDWAPEEIKKIEDYRPYAKFPRIYRNKEGRVVYSSEKLDLMFRLKRYLEDGFFIDGKYTKSGQPEKQDFKKTVQVPMTGQIQDSDLHNITSSFLVPYDENPDVFVNNVMKAVFGDPINIHESEGGEHLRWIRQYKYATGAEVRLRFLAALLKSGAVPTIQATAQECLANSRLEGCRVTYREMTAEAVVEDVMGLYRTFHFNKEQVDFYSRIGQDRRSTPHKIFLKEEKNYPLGHLQATFNFLQFNSLGFDVGTRSPNIPPRIDFQLQAQNFAKLLFSQRTARFLFELDERLNGAMLEHYGGLMFTEFSRFQNFVKAAEKFPEERQHPFQLSVQEPPVMIPLIEEGSGQHVHNLIRKFHNETMRTYEDAYQKLLSNK